ncbi:MAG: hypothetical protein JWP81_2723 [Ferruginibacter sp.]|nr:hypothetical protein [Ferruginibacter sp.]
MKLFTTLLMVCCIQMMNGQDAHTGIFDKSADIGKPKSAGSTRYDPASQTYYLKGAGFNIWFNRDEFQYVYKKIGGDFIVTADFAFLGDKGNGHKKIGWMLRESLDEGAASYNATTHGDGLTVLQWRPLRGAYMRDPEDEIFFPKKSVFKTIQMERIGKRITMRVANWGEPLQEVGSTDMFAMKDSVFVGLFICSHDSNKIEEAKIWNVRIDKPVMNKYGPNPQVKIPAFTGVLGCRMETMDVFSGERKIIHQSAGKFEAPNWMPGGKNLLFNEKGGIYTIPAEGGTPVKLNTGALDNNNNDHGISFNGKMLAISHQRVGLPGGGSTVYVLPLAGGEPKLITQQTPSYWHGWSPDGKEVTVVGQRKGSNIYNLYKVAVDNGNETALTNNTEGHVDGPEYSPDGKFIYYNANRTGTMQIWRMKPDGSSKEQLTFDERHNWFPHISPDGKWMVYISFPNDIEPNGHPSYQKVTLNLMPVAGGAPRVIAYLYGGQGTINVNSWSPDSKHIAFVSNSE